VGDRAERTVSLEIKPLTTLYEKDQLDSPRRPTNGSSASPTKENARVGSKDSQDSVTSASKTMAVIDIADDAEAKDAEVDSLFVGFEVSDVAMQQTSASSSKFDEPLLKAASERPKRNSFFNSQATKLKSFLSKGSKDSCEPIPPYPSGSPTSARSPSPGLSKLFQKVTRRRSKEEPPVENVVFDPLAGG
jgi:hypothetical protein